ncbi:MAG: FixH family protein [Burkholderiaceae bacterium]
MQTSPRHWTREPWPWIILGMLGTVVVASLVTLFIAMSTTDSLVADDYTKHGKAINQRLEKDNAAHRLGVVIKPAVTSQGDGLVRIEAALSIADPAATRPESLKLSLSHPTINKLDTQLTLARLPSGLYFVVVSPPKAGFWHAAFESPDGRWRVRTRLEINQGDNHGK